MRKTSVLLFVSAWASLAQNPWQGKPGLLLSFSATGANQVEIQIGQFSNTEPYDPMNLSGIDCSDPLVANRYLGERTHGQYFGYDISAEETGVAGQYRVTIAPLTWNPKDAALTAVRLPKYPAPQIVSEGDIIEMDLLVSADGKQKISDY